MKKFFFVGLVAGVALAASTLPAAAAELTLCGVKANVVLKDPAANADPKLKAFFGIWDKGEWAGGLCNALVVSEINGSNATVEYFYGTAPGVPTAGSFVKTDAVVKGKSLSFKSKLGADVSYELVGNELKGWFNSTQLTKKLQKHQ